MARRKLLIVIICIIAVIIFLPFIFVWGIFMGGGEIYAKGLPKIVQGVVVDTKTNSPIEGVNISLQSSWGFIDSGGMATSSSVTDNKGRFSVRSKYSHINEITFSKKGYYFKRISGLRDSAEDEFNIFIQQRENVKVTLEQQKEILIPSVTGYLPFEQLIPGSNDIKLEKSDLTLRVILKEGDDCWKESDNVDADMKSLICRDPQIIIPAVFKGGLQYAGENELLMNSREPVPEIGYFYSSPLKVGMYYFQTENPKLYGKMLLRISAHAEEAEGKVVDAYRMGVIYITSPDKKAVISECDDATWIGIGSVECSKFWPTY